MEEVAIKEREDLLILPQSEISFLPALMEDEILEKEKCLKLERKILEYEWQHKKFKEEALKHLGYALEMANLSQKEKIKFHLEEMGNNVLRELFLERGIETEPFWDFFSGYTLYPLDNQKVELPPEVFEIVKKTKDISSLEYRVLKSKPQVKIDPILIVRVKGNKKWFKILEW